MGIRNLLSIGWLHARRMKRRERQSEKETVFAWNVMTKRYTEEELMAMDNTTFVRVQERELRRWRIPRQIALFTLLGAIGIAAIIYL